MLLYLSSKHSNVILNVSIKKYIYYNEIYSIPAKSRGIMTIPADPYLLVGIMAENTHNTMIVLLQLGR